VSAQTSGTRARLATGMPAKYELDVTACEVTDLVRHAGGWLYDRSMAGWAVTVALPGELVDDSPLRILGLSTERAEDDDDDGTPAHAPALAASVEALAANRMLRADVLRAMNRGLVEVTLWGSSAGAQGRAEPTRQFSVNGLGGRVEPTQHVLSAAARAFKVHALRAVGLDEPVGAVETFLRRPTAVGVG
jgi:hypothetical protein